MFIAKHFPGQFNAPFCKGIEPTSLRTGIINSTSTWSKLYDHTTTPAHVNVGSQKYIVIMSCPAFSLHKAPTGTVSSGIYMSTINDPQLAKNYMGFDNSCQISTATLYGDDGLAVAENVFTWA